MAGRLSRAGGNPFVTRKDPGEIMVWDVESGSNVLSLTGHSDKVLSVSVSPDGQRIASSSFDGTIKIWDTASGTNTLTLQGHSGFAKCVFSPDGRRIVSGGSDTTVRVWDAMTGSETPGS